MSSSFHYVLGTVFAPRRAFRRLTEDARPFGRGLRIVLLTGVLCGITAMALAATGAVPMAPILLPLAAENYYVWQAFLALPMLLAAWVAASLAVHILGSGRKRGGSLKKTLGAFGFAQSMPVLLLWAVESLIAVFYGLGMEQQEMVDILSIPSAAQTVFLAAIGVALAWSFLLAVLAASVSARARWVRALFLGVLAEVLFIGPIIFLLR